CPKTSLTDLQGIVLIDEMDAHLHPKYQLLRVAFYKKNIKKRLHVKKNIYLCLNNDKGEKQSVGLTSKQSLSTKRTCF
ncbi:MAG: hypothetical protein RL329_1193, partial [Bacteroidota bacterium]